MAVRAGQCQRQTDAINPVGLGYLRCDWHYGPDMGLLWPASGSTMIRVIWAWFLIDALIALPLIYSSYLKGKKEK